MLAIKKMAEGGSAIQPYNSLFICDFYSFSQIHPTFYPTKYIGIIDADLKHNFICRVTARLSQTPLTI